MNRYGKMFKDKNGDKNENNKLMYLHIDDDKLLEKYKTNSIKIKDLKDIELDNLPAQNDKYINTKIRTHDDKVYTILKDQMCQEMEQNVVSFTVPSIDSLLVYDRRYYLQVYSNNCAYKIIDEQKIDYLEGNPFETDENQVL